MAAYLGALCTFHICASVSCFHRARAGLSEHRLSTSDDIIHSNAVTLDREV